MGSWGETSTNIFSGQIGPAGAIYQVMEFTGPVMDEMSMDGQIVDVLSLPSLPERNWALLTPTRRSSTGLRPGLRCLSSRK